MKGATLISLATAALLASGCSDAPVRAADRPAVSLQALYTGVQCGRAASSPSLAVITSAAALHQVMAKVSRTVLAGRPTESFDVSFDREVVLVVETGRRPTAGYGVALGASEAVLHDGVADVPVTWREPTRGAVVAQVVTSPCVLIRMVRAAYTSVRIVDQHNRVRLEQALQPSGGM